MGWNRIRSREKERNILVIIKVVKIENKIKGMKAGSGRKGNRHENCCTSRCAAVRGHLVQAHVWLSSVTLGVERNRNRLLKNLKNDRFRKDLVWEFVRARTGATTIGPTIS